MPVLTSITPTTERDAVNTMLLSIGESALLPAVSIETASLEQADIQSAIEILKGALRELLTGDWRFNRQFGIEVPPYAQYTWVDTKGTSTLLNIFKLPSGVLKWKLTRCQENGALDLIEKRSEKYKEGGSAVKVLYDRAENRDGAKKDDYPYVYLDVYRSVDFEDLPETARKFVTMRSARRLAGNLGFLNKVSISANDELLAWRELLDDQDDSEKVNLFDNPDAQEWFGGRPHANLWGNRKVPRGGA